MRPLDLVPTMVLKPMAAISFPRERKEIMRNPSILIIVLALTAAGCAGRYDRELLGEPAPVFTATPEEYRAARDAEADSEYTDALAEDELIHTPMEYTMFDELDPYGTWYESGEFGTVWRPIMGPGWQPFVRGHWIWTSYGWMWVSYEPFGWATYHYGNWWLDPMLGWIWVPGYDWSPCPVDWFYADGYLGWAPLPPSGHYWDDPWEDQGRYKDGWVVVEAGKFKNTDVGNERIAPQRFKSEYRTGTAVRRAPDTKTIERATHERVKETNVRIDSRRVGERELRKVVLPNHERQIVERYPMPVVAPVTQLPATGGGTGGAVVAPPSAGSGGKSKGTLPPPAKKPAPEKFKSKDSSKGSSSDAAKDADKDSGGKSKDGGSKDDNDSGKAKAKGKKR